MRATVIRLLALGFAGLVVSLVLTPIFRELNRRLGMVDRPDARRINKVPIPRGGGIALFLSVLVVYSAFLHFCGNSLMSPDRIACFPVFAVLCTAIVCIGYADDKWSLGPRVKLLGQILIAFATWAWGGLGIGSIISGLPAWIDCPLTVFWIVGAINAFNLIDGLDGLATGLAMIATAGMAGALIFTGSMGLTYFHAVFFGALFGFLRYNYNPASVFLGDSGSMFIGFILAVLPLHFNTTSSFFVSVGVPLLAMGVPIFDTSLAILRRSIRHLLVQREGASAGNDKVMTADTDHLHHRILRASGLNQRKAAWVLYGIACFLVLFALGSIVFWAHRAGLWLVGLTIASVIIVRNFARIELYDTAKLLGNIAHDPNFRSRRKLQRLTVPITMFLDFVVIVISYFVISWAVNRPLSSGYEMLALPIIVFAFFICLVFFRAYQTVWSRAVLSNYIRLLLASVLGSVIAALGIYFAPGLSVYKLRASFALFAVLPFIGFLSVRLVRPFVRDLFYLLDCRRLIMRKDVSRILVYGAGLRYAAFRRELVRTAAVNRRIIVGILDDDILIRGHYIGGIQVKGTINDAPEVINAMNVDSVVITCSLDDRWRQVVVDILRPTGVRVSYFKFAEEEVK